MNDLVFYDDFTSVLYDIKPQLEEWFNGINDNEMDFEEKQSLLDEICLYRMNKQSKALYDVVRNKRTVNERLDRLKKSISRLGLFLLSNPTQKGRELSDMLLDFTLNPNDYVKDTQQATANLDKINDFFQDISISNDNKKELFNIIK